MASYNTRRRHHYAYTCTVSRDVGEDAAGVFVAARHRCVLARRDARDVPPILGEYYIPPEVLGLEMV